MFRNKQVANDILLQAVKNNDLTQVNYAIQYAEDLNICLMYAAKHNYKSVIDVLNKNNAHKKFGTVNGNFESIKTITAFKDVPTIYLRLDQVITLLNDNFDISNYVTEYFLRNRDKSTFTLSQNRKVYYNRNTKKYQLIK